MELFVINIFVNILIGLVGFFIRQHLLAIRKDIDEVKHQVLLTNGRVIRLEEWKTNHTKMDEQIHEGNRTGLADLYKKVDTLFSRCNL